jgi:porin
MESNPMTRALRTLALAVATGLWMGAQAQVLPIKNYSGELRTRSTLSGDWGGARTAWSAKGVEIDLDTTATWQYLFAGGFEDDDEVLGSTALTVHLDTDHAGLWPGGLFTLRAEGRYGNGVQRDSGALSPLDTDALFPNVTDHLADDVLEITEASAVQFLSKKFGLVAGLLNTELGDTNELAGNLRATDKFLNAAFLLSLVEFRTAPAATLGAGLLVLPHERIMAQIVVLDSEESSGEDPFDTDDGTTINLQLGWKHAWAGLPGKQTFGFLIGFDRDYSTVGLDSRTVLGSLLPGQELPTERDSWSLYYNMHQYVSGDGGGRGWGVFARAAVSDGDVNPIEWNLAAGVGGRGLLAARPDDTFGAGYYHLELAEGALTRAFDMGDEQGFEIWYNLAITPWLHVTADLQVIDTAIGQPVSNFDPPVLVPGGGLRARLKQRIGAIPDSDTAVVFGLRTHVEF